MNSRTATQVDAGVSFTLASETVFPTTFTRDCFAAFLRQDAFALLVECARLQGHATSAIFLKTICKLVDMYKGDLLLVARAGGCGGNNISLLFNLINHLHSSAATKETTGYLCHRLCTHD
jgi:hypothetical protein